MREPRPLAGRKYSWEQESRARLKYQLGAYIKLMRKQAKFSQAAAALRAGLSRAQWNRIENGHDLPRASNIPAIADAIYLHPVTLYMRAGYPIPQWEKSYNMEKAARDLWFALEKSATLMEFILKMDVVWQEYQIEYLNKPKRIKVDLTYAEVLRAVISSLSSKQQLELARAILKRHNKS